MEKTRTPGIYKRGSRYVIAYRADGKQRYESFRTLDEARRAKAARTTDIQRGEHQEQTRVTLCEYALGWVERYQGRGRRGFRDPHPQRIPQTTRTVRLPLLPRANTARGHQPGEGGEFSLPGCATPRSRAERSQTARSATSSSP
jgi:hypothetical protein